MEEKKLLVEMGREDQTLMDLLGEPFMAKIGGLSATDEPKEVVVGIITGFQLGAARAVVYTTVGLFVHHGEVFQYEGGGDKVVPPLAWFEWPTK